MTGFSGARIEREWGAISLELSSVNHRYQEIYVRLPRELQAWEPWFHQRVRALYRRGKVQARVEITWAASAQTAAINRDVLKSYYRQLSELEASLCPGDEGHRRIALESLVGLPGVIDARERFGVSDATGTEALLDELLAAGAASWNEMRRLEGSHLEAAVGEHLAALEELAARISGLWEGARDNAFEAMTGRIKHALSAAGVPFPDDSRLAQEALIIADRWDISEELARLSSHITKFKEAGASPESSGRKLDFLVQEINRELNTLNSKVSDSEVRWLAVEAKAAIERVREQIQNLE
jgi:uncharacterized protein (TIGR00255 family)